MWIMAMGHGYCILHNAVKSGIEAIQVSVFIKVAKFFFPGYFNDIHVGESILATAL